MTVSFGSPSSSSGAVTSTPPPFPEMTLPSISVPRPSVTQMAARAEVGEPRPLPSSRVPERVVPMRLNAITVESGVPVRLRRTASAVSRANERLGARSVARPPPRATSASAPDRSVGGLAAIRAAPAPSGRSPSSGSPRLYSPPMRMASNWLPEITLPAPGAPITFRSPTSGPSVRRPGMKTPMVLGRAAVPARLVPIWLPTTTASLPARMTPMSCPPMVLLTIWTPSTRNRPRPVASRSVRASWPLASRPIVLDATTVPLVLGPNRPTPKVARIRFPSVSASPPMTTRSTPPSSASVRTATAVATSPSTALPAAFSPIVLAAMTAPSGAPPASPRSKSQMPPLLLPSPVVPATITLPAPASPIWALRAAP